MMERYDADSWAGPCGGSEVSSRQALPLLIAHVVRAACPLCDCLELEGMYWFGHVCFEEIGFTEIAKVPSAAAALRRGPCGCSPPHHLYKCEHMGHRGKFIDMCVECEDVYKDVMLSDSSLSDCVSESDGGSESESENVAALMGQMCNLDM